MPHDTPTVVKVKEADRTKDWQGCGETEPPQVPRWEYTTVQPL